MPSHGNAAAESNVRSPVAQMNGPGRVTSTARPAGEDTTSAPANGAGHQWADRPASRGRDDAKSSFGSVVLPLFSDTLCGPGSRSSTGYRHVWPSVVESVGRRRTRSSLAIGTRSGSRCAGG